MSWWIRPLVRLIAALLLPFLVPAFITAIIWLMPGDPVDNLCPEGICTEQARDGLRTHWHMDSATGFYTNWISRAVQLDLGKSTYYAGEEVGDLISGSFPTTTVLVLVAIVPILLGTLAASLGWLSRTPRPVFWSLILLAIGRIRLRGGLVRGTLAILHDAASFAVQVFSRGLGIVPTVILALFAMAYIVVTYGPLQEPDAHLMDWILSGFSSALPYDWPHVLSLILGGLVLGIADGALQGAIGGTQSVFDTENRQRYIQIAVLRGESTLANALPNVLPALVGQLRGRILLLLSGAVVVESVLRIDGIGDLLWLGTINQDYFLVLAAATGFALLSSVLLAMQAIAEILVAMWVRRSPRVPEEDAGPIGEPATAGVSE